MSLPTENVIHITTESEFNELINNHQHVFVKWGAEFCGPCKLIAPQYEKLAIEYKKRAKFVSMKADSNELMDLVRDSDVSSIPAFQFYKNGRLVKKIVGANPKILIDFVATEFV